MDDMEIQEGVAGGTGQETDERETGEACETEVQIPVGVATLRSVIMGGMRVGPQNPEPSREEQAARLQTVYAEYVRSHDFQPGQLVEPKRLGREGEPGRVLGVVLDPNGMPGPQDAPWETLRIGRFRNGQFMTDVFDPLRFQPYVPASEAAGQGGGE
ncbi:MAG: hypothetical protein AAGU21_01205 [Solidesulfovibrio sp.]|uniref:hypothetical protein n=1 Tax=Solidesulfovibrio sp. TaxID=2910990 RepID=UPI002B21B88C|nr:hypothetical protein [Solidesulfovibrio sp.]MEA4857081.1 hypothetical protein [Solidesulfovibrio sp.]